MNPIVFLGLLIMWAADKAKVINDMVMEVDPFTREFTAATEPILKVPISA